MMWNPLLYGTMAGLLAGLFESLYGVGYFNEQGRDPLFWLSFGLVFGVLLLGVRRVRLIHNGVLPFKEAFLSGMNISVVTGIAAGAVVWFYQMDFEPPCNGEDCEKYRQARTIYQFISWAFSGLLMSVPVAFILRTRKTN